MMPHRQTAAACNRRHAPRKAPPPCACMLLHRCCLNVLYKSTNNTTKHKTHQKNTHTQNKQQNNKTKTKSTSKQNNNKHKKHVPKFQRQNKTTKNPHRKINGNPPIGPNQVGYLAESLHCSGLFCPLLCVMCFVLHRKKEPMQTRTGKASSTTGSIEVFLPCRG